MLIRPVQVATVLRKITEPLFEFPLKRPIRGDPFDLALQLENLMAGHGRGKFHLDDSKQIRAKRQRSSWREDASTKRYAA